ncbi:MFS transporter [Arthrobacter sp.]|uniref:MFS transporter n=1 Tax=Arthrobacter sp. TaxID=1667 RepID=UPI003A9010F0
MTSRWHVPRRLAGPFTDRRSRRLLGAFLVSELGDGITAVIVPLGVYAVSDSVVALASTFLGRMIFGSIFAAAGGIIADGMDRRLLLLASYVVRALLVAALVPLANGHAVAFAVVGVLVGASGSFDNPAAEAALRSVYRHDLQALAAARKSGKTVSQMIGPAVGGLLFGLGGLPLALSANVLTFMAALVLIFAQRALPVRERTVSVRCPARPTAGAALASFRGRIPPVVAMAFLSAASASFLVAVATALAVPYLAGLPHAPAGAYGFALSAYSIGALAGLWLAGSISWGRVRLRSVLLCSAIAFGALTILSVLVPRWEMLAFAWLVWGIAFGPEDVVGDTRVATVVPDTWLSRVYSAWSILGKLGAAGGYVLVIAVGGLDTRQTLFIVGIAYAVTVPAALMLLPRETPDET